MIRRPPEKKTPVYLATPLLIGTHEHVESISDTFHMFSSTWLRLRQQKCEERSHKSNLDIFRTVASDQEVFAVRNQDITIIYFIAQYEILQIADAQTNGLSYSRLQIDLERCKICVGSFAIAIYHKQLRGERKESRVNVADFF